MSRFVGWVLAVVAALLCIKGAFDIATADGAFPAWFPPLFFLGSIGAGAFGLLLAAQPKSPSPRSGGIAIAAWVLLALSFVTVSSLHGFLPFRLSGLSYFWAGVPSLRLNLVIAGAGAIITILLALTYLSSARRRLVLGSLPVLGLALLIPNDDCSNPFNIWWIREIGFSPLMFVPNAIATMCVHAVLTGPTPRLALFGIVGICASTLFLGLGHQTNLIW